MLPRRGMLSTPLESPELPLGKYRHYKGELYEVVGVACHEETHAWLVVYKPLYDHEGYPDLWVRPYEVFTETVVVGEVVVRRFEFVPDEVVDVS